MFNDTLPAMLGDQLLPVFVCSKTQPYICQKFLRSRCFDEGISCARGLPQILKKCSENGGSNENLLCGCPSIPRIAQAVSIWKMILVIDMEASETGLQVLKDRQDGRSTILEEVIKATIDWFEITFDGDSSRTSSQTVFEMVGGQEVRSQP